MDTAIKIYFSIGFLLALMMPFCVKDIMQARDEEIAEADKDDVEELRYIVSILPAWAMSIAMTMLAFVLIFAWPAFLGKSLK